MFHGQPLKLEVHRLQNTPIRKRFGSTDDLARSHTARAVGTAQRCGAGCSPSCHGDVPDCRQQLCSRDYGLWQHRVCGHHRDAQEKASERGGDAGVREEFEHRSHQRSRHAVDCRRRCPGMLTKHQLRARRSTRPCRPGGRNTRSAAWRALARQRFRHPMDDLFREIVDYQRRVGSSDDLASSGPSKRFDDPRMAVYHVLYARSASCSHGHSWWARIKMVARMKERFPILARQPRPEAPQLEIGWPMGFAEEPTEAEKELRRRTWLDVLRREEDRQHYMRLGGRCHVCTACALHMTRLSPLQL
eukprot:Skav206348  [mRNA]  locus=scaffold3448:62651:71861:+ [translate_table: standard]